MWGPSRKSVVRVFHPDRPESHALVMDCLEKGFGMGEKEDESNYFYVHVKTFKDLIDSLQLHGEQLIRMQGELCAYKLFHSRIALPEMNVSGIPLSVRLNRFDEILALVEGNGAGPELGIQDPDAKLAVISALRFLLNTASVGSIQNCFKPFTVVEGGR